MYYTVIPEKEVYIIANELTRPVLYRPQVTFVCIHKNMVLVEDWRYPTIGNTTLIIYTNRFHWPKSISLNSSRGIGVEHYISSRKAKFKLFLALLNRLLLFGRTLKPIKDNA